MPKSVRVKDRDGKEYLRCPRCGKLFVRGKDYTKHIHRAHIQRRIGKRYIKIRMRKKMEKPSK